MAKSANSSIGFWTTLCGPGEPNVMDFTLNSSLTNFSDCLNITFFIWPTPVFLLIGTILHVYYLHSKPSNGRLTWKWWTILKYVINGVLVMVETARLGLHLVRIINGDSLSFTTTLSMILDCFCVIDLIILTELNRRRGCRSSGVIWLGFLLLFICGILPFIQNVINVYSNSADIKSSKTSLAYYNDILYICYFLLITSDLILNSFADVRKLDKDSDQKELPESISSFLSKITWFWFTRIAVLASKRSLTTDDLWKIRGKDAAEYLSPKRERHWNAALIYFHQRTFPRMTYLKKLIKKIPVLWGSEHKRQWKQRNRPDGPSLILSLIWMVKWQLIPAVVLRMIGDLLSFAIPQILKALLTFIETPSIELWIGIVLALLMFVCSTAQTAFQQQGIYRMLSMAMNVRTSLVSAVYKKALQMSPTARKDATVGELVNLMAVDVQRIGDVFQYLQQLWTTPTMIIVSLYFLYLELGYSALFGFCVMLILMPCNYLLSQYQKQNQSRMMKFKDKRMKLMNEIITGMKVLKLYAWEEPFENRVLGVRANELKTLNRSSYFDAMNTFIMTCAPFLVAVASFAAFVLSSPDNILTPQKAFVSLALFNILRQPLNTLPGFISALVQASVSNKRLQDYLSWPEINPQLVITNGDQDDAILIENASFAWSNGNEKSTLKRICFSVKPGQLVAILGPVGCGKSSLLAALLGNMEPKGGLVYVKGSIAYVPQQPWIQSSTVRNNIVFTKAYQENAYERVVQACALGPDLDNLPNGDATEISEKGINLSGGQKQRVSLARAVYQDKDVYLMDDPLAAVDAYVGRHIFEKVISNQGILKGKTRLLVTHSLAYLKRMDNIFVMKDGKITQSGTLAELIRQGGPFAEYLETFTTQHNKDTYASSDDDLVVKEILEGLQKDDQGCLLRSRSVGSKTGSQKTEGIVKGWKKYSAVERKVERLDNIQIKRIGSIGQSAQLGQNIRHEKVQKGKVQWRVYMDYFSAVGYISFLTVLAAYVVNAALGVGTNVWLSEWSEDSSKKMNESMNVYIRLGAYSALGIGQGVFVLMAALVGVRLMVSAGAKLHDRLLFTLMRSPMTFYDITPLGSIISRIGKDVEVVDNSLPMTLRLWIMQSLNILSAIIVVLISTPIIAAAIVPLAFCYYFLQGFCVSVGQQLRRLESATRAPIFSHFGETLAGVTSIRAYAVQRQFIDEANFRLDQHMRVVHAAIVSNRWREVWLQTLGNLLVMFSALFAVLGRNDGILAGVVGLSVSCAASITNTLQIAVRLLSDLETNLVAVERIKEYSELPIEGPWITDTRPPKYWPANGIIDFERFQLRYQPDQELVLRGLDWRVESQEKVGIVGRTGAGKSSLALALFRIVEAAGGTIVIDNLDISKIGLHDLRSRLAIIPQDPVLFSGTLRVNLDPFDEHGDFEIWSALEQAHLKPFVAQLADGLLYKVTEGGDNLSVGQRQLICLARALLRRSKILILDEATAAVDLETEKLILDTIRNRFDDCTIITIAHRLNTVMDSDRILVISNGCTSEHGTPTDLLSHPHSTFFTMAKDAGLLGAQHSS